MSIVYFRFAQRVPDPPVRAPVLERWLARADAAVQIEDWRAHAFARLAPGLEVPPAACGARVCAADLRAVAPAPRSWLFVATPVHFVVGLHGVQLAANGLLALTATEAEMLVQDFNALFASSGAQLLRGRGTQLLCALDAAPASAREAPEPPATCDPENALGRDIGDFLPRGAAAAPLRRLMSELEMWLHGHALNLARRERSAPEIGALWLWGGARADRALPPLDIWSAGDDPLFGAYAAVERYPGTMRSGVLSTQAAPGEPEFAQLEHAWLEPALADLRGGRLEALELSAGHMSHRVGRAAVLRFFRRVRPWWEVIAGGEGA